MILSKCSLSNSNSWLQVPWMNRETKLKQGIFFYSLPTLKSFLSVMSFLFSRPILPFSLVAPKNILKYPVKLKKKRCWLCKYRLLYFMGEKKSSGNICLRKWSESIKELYVIQLKEPVTCPLMFFGSIPTWLKLKMKTSRKDTYVR